MDGNEHNAAQRDLPYEMLKLQSIEEKVGEQPPDLPAPAGHEASRSEESPPLADYDRLNATQVEKRLVRLSPEQHRKVILAAEKAGKDVAQWVTETLEQAIGSTGH